MKNYVGRDTTIRVGVFVLTLLFIARGTNADSVITTDFDDGTFQGWTPYFDPGGATITVSPTGGNPGGRVRAVDTLGGGGSFGIRAPASYLGDLSNHDGVEWDQKILTPSFLIWSTQLYIYGSDGTRYRNSISYTSGVPSGTVGVWRTLYAPFDASEWHLSSGSMTFEEVLSNVVEMRIGMDVSQGAIPTQESEVDNIKLFIPEPASISLLLLGLGLLRRRQTRQS